ncbi:MAG: BamA/TamA family outer membrane protein [Bacteroidales bacterium]
MRIAGIDCYKYIILSTLLVLLAACSSTKHVPQGEYLVDEVLINIDNNRTVKSSELIKYLRQRENHKVFWDIKLQLAVYNISGRDTSSGFNRWIQGLGAAPEIYDQSLAEASVSQLQKVLVNKGFMDAEVSYDTIHDEKKRKLKVKYNITTNTPHQIKSISYEIDNDSLRKLIMAESDKFVVQPNDLFDRNKLEEERKQITLNLQDKGYYAFNKDYIVFLADTTENSNEVDLTLRVLPPVNSSKIPNYNKHEEFYYRDVIFVTNYNHLGGVQDNSFSAQDTITYDDYKILYDDDRYISEKVLTENCYFAPNKRYNTSDISKTYQAYGRLGIIKYININLIHVEGDDGKRYIDAYILLTKGKPHTVTLSLDGTNSEGDLGFGVGATYQNRNIGRGGEVLTTEFLASYQNLSGDLGGFINNNYSEYSGEVGVLFPKFKAPLLSESFKRKINASTQLTTAISYQQRPEYTRIIAGAGWEYIWSNRDNTQRQIFDLIDVSYIYLPETTDDFLDDITNPLLLYSYEDHFIMKMGYTFYKTNKRSSTQFNPIYQDRIYTIRAAIETAGNLLYGISNMVGQERDNGVYKIFGINYAQYVKFDSDFTYAYKFNPRNMLAFRAGAGVAIPYANSSILPFEKRFYGGGANGVRGWNVRTLGPGSYNSVNSVDYFIYQCGDIRFDASMEYRAKLFWVLELGAFIDAGNIWTIRDYEDQAGGVFTLSSFYKEIALAYGLGLRMDFTFFLLRFDLGIKAYNPAENEIKWPIFNPNFSRDATFHFSVGYPF